MKTREPRLVSIHRLRAKNTRKEVKIKESKELKEFSDTLKQIIREDGRDPDSKATRNLVKLREVLKSHKLSYDEDDMAAATKALFSGCKLQLKPVAWDDDDVVAEIQVVLKWGGVLTEMGKDHATALGAHFRRNMYPASEDGAGLLRLHATFRHDLKIRTSDEGRVMKTGAAFTKGLLELEGDISPILVSLIHRGRSDVNMLDRAGPRQKQRSSSVVRRYLLRAPVASEARSVRLARLSVPHDLRRSLGLDLSRQRSVRRVPLRFKLAAQAA